MFQSFLAALVLGSLLLIQGPMFRSQNYNASAPYTDSFAGSGALSGNWTQVTDVAGNNFVPLIRASGYAAPTTSPGHGMAFYSGGTFGTTRYAQGSISWVSGNYSGVCPYLDPNGNGYCYIPSVSQYLFMVNGSGSNPVIAVCSASASGDAIRVDSTPSATTVTDETTSTVLCSGSAYSYSPANPGIYVDQRASSTDKITNFAAQ